MQLSTAQLVGTGIGAFIQGAGAYYLWHEHKILAVLLGLGAAFAAGTIVMSQVVPVGASQPAKQ